jgi:signal transduction histidine kinase
MKIFGSVHALLLIYVVVALVFWEFSLQKQSSRIYEQEYLVLKIQTDSTQTPALYSQNLALISRARDSRTKQYIGEGATFLVVILIGAFVVYKSFQRTISLSRQQNNFMLSVTHELKSPIAGIKLNLQTLERRKLDEDKQRTLVERCIREANRLNDLCNNMLYASRIEGGQYAPTRESLDLAEMANSCFSDYDARYPGRFRDDIVDSCQLQGDKMMLQIAINNLLENAIKYAPAHSEIVLKLEKTEGQAVLSVADLGPGVPDAEKKKIFNKFYRIGNEESRKAKGTGLGLYLTNKIVRQHNGRISVQDNSPIGAIFEIRLPLV